MARVEISLGNWNNQAEYDAYKALSPMDQAADDFELPSNKGVGRIQKNCDLYPVGKRSSPTLEWIRSLQSCD